MPYPGDPVQRPSIGTATRVVVQVLAFWAIAELGRAVVTTLGLSLPGNLVGMVALLLLLLTGVVPAAWVEPAATLLIRHLGFFFVPIAVGLMTIGDLLRAQGIPLLAVIIASAGAGIAAAGLVTQAGARRLPAEVPPDPGGQGDPGGAR